MQKDSLSAGSAPPIPTTEVEGFTAPPDTSMKDLASFQGAVMVDHRTTWVVSILLRRSCNTQSGVPTMPSASLPLYQKRCAYVLDRVQLGAKSVVIFQISSRHPLIRLTGLTAEMAHRTSTSLAYLFSSTVFLFFKQHHERVKHPALWSVHLLYIKICRHIRWSVSSMIESEVIVIPVRDLSKRKGLVHGAVPSRKLDRMVRYESLIARGCIYVFEHDPRVLTYEEEPCTIHYRFDGSERRYTPDFAVTWSNHKPTLVECKPVAHVGDPENALKWTAARLWAVRRQYEFVLVTDASLRAYGALLPNLELLAVHGYQRIPPPACEYLLKTAQSINGPFTPNELVRRTPQLEAIRTRSYIWHLLYVGEFSTDLTLPLHFDGTVLSWKGDSHVETKPIVPSGD